MLVHTNRRTGGNPADGEGLPWRPQMHQLHHGGPEAQSVPLAPLSNQLLKVSAELHPRGGMDHLVPGVGSKAGSQLAHGKTGSLPAPQKKKNCLSKGSALKKREQTLFWPSHLSQNIRWFKPMAVMNTCSPKPARPETCLYYIIKLSASTRMSPCLQACHLMAPAFVVLQNFYQPLCIVHLDGSLDLGRGHPQ